MAYSLRPICNSFQIDELARKEIENDIRENPIDWLELNTVDRSQIKGSKIILPIIGNEFYFHPPKNKPDKKYECTFNQMVQYLVTCGARFFVNRREHLVYFAGDFSAEELELVLSLIVKSSNVV